MRAVDALRALVEPLKRNAHFVRAEDTIVFSILKVIILDHNHSVIHEETSSYH